MDLGAERSDWLATFSVLVYVLERLGWDGVVTTGEGGRYGKASFGIDVLAYLLALLVGSVISAMRC